MLHLVQVCNVGQIVGGTAACAWTVTRAFPDCRHSIICLSQPDTATTAAFAPSELLHRKRVSADDIHRLGADVVLLHNTARGRCDARLPALTLQYVHSHIDAAPADRALYCSHWLAELSGNLSGDVCLQAVPRPARLAAGSAGRALRRWPVIGRICTPTPRKWPASLVSFYQRLATRFPHARWEFVGCPRALVVPLTAACDGRARFFDASWSARSRLWTWDALLYHHPDLTESFGRTCAEAMRAGCVPIVDRRGGFVEQVKDGCGWLCRNEADFASAVDQLHDRQERRRTSRAASNHANDAFSLARCRASLLERFSIACKTGNS